MAGPARSVAILGGGLAGASAAIALAQAGCLVQVIEKDPNWRGQSSGMFLYSNALASLRDLGVIDAVLKQGFAVPEGRNLYLEADGREITRTRYPAQDGLPAILGIRRAALHRILADRTMALGVSVSFGVTLAGYLQDGDLIWAKLSDGRKLPCDALIGAEGLKSPLRWMLGTQASPRYSGFGVWRAVHDRPTEIRDKFMIMGRGLRLGIMPISADQLYIFGSCLEPKSARYAPAELPSAMRERFRDFEGPAKQFLDQLPEVEISYTAVEEVVMDLPWHKGCVGLIGDACHGATPFMGQGGAMALEDGVILARCLASDLAVPDALELFGQARFEICRFVQDVSQAVGQAGAAEDNVTLAARSARMRADAQKDVDGFFARLDQLTSQSHQRLNGVLSQQTGLTG